MKQWKRYKSYILPYKSAFILGPLMMVTEVLGEILLPKFMSMIINHGVAQKDGGYILKMGLVMAITSFLMAAGGILGAYFAAKASISFTSDLRRRRFILKKQGAVPRGWNLYRHRTVPEENSQLLFGVI